MADAIGLAASLVSIAGAAIETSKALFRFGDAVVKARKQVNQLAKELSHFSVAPSALARVLQEHGALLEQRLITDVEIHRDECETIIETISTELGKLNPRAMTMLDRAKWYFRDELVMRHIARLDRAKASLMLMVAVLNLASSLNIHKSIDSRSAEVQRQYDTATTFVAVTQAAYEEVEELERDTISGNVETAMGEPRLVDHSTFDKVRCISTALHRSPVDQGNTTQRLITAGSASDEDLAFQLSYSAQSQAPRIIRQLLVTWTSVSDISDLPGHAYPIEDIDIEDGTTEAGVAESQEGFVIDAVTINTLKGRRLLSSVNAVYVEEPVELADDGAFPLQKASYRIVGNEMFCGIRIESEEARTELKQLDIPAVSAFMFRGIEIVCMNKLSWDYQAEAPIWQRFFESRQMLNFGFFISNRVTELKWFEKSCCSFFAIPLKEFPLWDATPGVRQTISAVLHHVLDQRRNCLRLNRSADATRRMILMTCVAAARAAYVAFEEKLANGLNTMPQLSWQERQTNITHSLRNIWGERYDGLSWQVWYGTNITNGLYHADEIHMNIGFPQKKFDHIPDSFPTLRPFTPSHVAPSHVAPSPLAQIPITPPPSLGSAESEQRLPVRKSWIQRLAKR
ncbi:hypothetical protein MMC18_000896 [Xylographa bjoerkii]|nr:hypothetical protein [Xylographa bjoerkii]